MTVVGYASRADSAQLADEGIRVSGAEELVAALATFESPATKLRNLGRLGPIGGASGTRRLRVSLDVDSDDGLPFSV